MLASVAFSPDQILFLAFRIYSISAAKNPMTSSKLNGFLDKGYLIFKNAIDTSSITALENHFSEVKNKGLPYYSQSKHNWRLFSDDIDEFGNLSESIEKFTDLFLCPTLGKLGRDILQSQEILNCLKKTHGFENYTLWSDMLFDKSTGTIDHYDNWYLDTFNDGHIVGAWIALENIDGSGGSFYVYPGSHHYVEKEAAPKSYDEFLAFCRNYADKNEPHELHVNKGDLILWHSKLIHGSTLSTANNLTRKSITAHYFPSHMLMRTNALKPMAQLSDDEYSNYLLKQQKSCRSFGRPIQYCKNRRQLVRWNLLGMSKILYSRILRRGNREHMHMSRSFQDN